MRELEWSQELHTSLGLQGPAGMRGVVCPVKTWLPLAGEGMPCHTSRVTTWKGQGEGLGKGATGAAAGSRAVRSNAGIVRGGEYLHPSNAVR